MKRAKARIKEIVRKGRGRSLSKVIGELTPFLRGWVNYFRLSQVKSSFEELDQVDTAETALHPVAAMEEAADQSQEADRTGIEKTRAYASASNGRGPWWNAGASHMNAAVPAKWLQQQGLMSLLTEHQRFKSLA